MQYIQIQQLFSRNWLLLIITGVSFGMLGPANSQPQPMGAAPQQTPARPDPSLGKGKAYILSPNSVGWAKDINESRNIAGAVEQNNKLYPCKWLWDEQQQTFAEVPVFENSELEGWASAINARGTVVGRVFLDRNPPRPRIETGFIDSWVVENAFLVSDSPHAINDIDSTGNICGWSGYSSVGFRATPNLQRWNHLYPPRSASYSYCLAMAIDDGTAVGYYLTSFNTPRACIWPAGGGFYSYASLLDNSERHSYAMDYDKEMAVGSIAPPLTGHVPCYWYRGSTVIINSQAGNGGANGVCRSNRDRAKYHIVGTNQSGAFLAICDINRNQVRIIDLTTRVIVPEGFRLIDAKAVNGHGDFVGIATHNQTGQSRAFFVKAPKFGW